MVSYATLALLLSALVAAAPVEVNERDTVIPTFQRGTEYNAADIGHLGTSHRAGVNYEKALSDPTKQPELPVGGRCVYAYAHQPKLEAIESTSPYVIDTNVQQGAIGDCGMGSAVAAIALRGQSKLLHDRIKVNGSTYEFTFDAAGEKVKVLVDDQLPALSGNTTNCAPLLGYQIAPKGLPAENAFVPLLEKAMAKYLDARVDRGEKRGYPGMEFIRGELVLSLLTGGTGARKNRVYPGMDDTMVSSLHDCLTGPNPCLLSSPPSTANESLFGYDRNSTHYYLPYGAGYHSAAITPKSESFWQVTDYDNNNATNLLVTSHAWAIDKERSRYDPTDLRNSIVRIINPWGVNYQPWAKLDKANAIELSFPTVASFFRAVMTIDKIPEQ